MRYVRINYKNWGVVYLTTRENKVLLIDPDVIASIAKRRGYKDSAYERVTDENGETICFVDVRTGELIDCENYCAPAGSRVITPAVQEARDKWKKDQVRQQMRRSNEPYIFASVDHDFCSLKPATLVRLIVLATYSTMDSTGLMEKERTPMTRAGICRVLGISQATATRLLNELQEYILLDDNGCVHLKNDKILFKGHLAKGHGRFQKIYRNRIRTIYTKTPQELHQYLGYVFGLLRYINVEYNCLCYNPMEKELSEIQYMTLDEFCEIIGFNPRKRSELKKTYQKLTYEIDGTNHALVAFVDTDGDAGHQKIFINPSIVYSGASVADVQILAGFCKLEKIGDLLRR